MIKGSVYVYIFYMYTHDKDIITEILSAPIFICVPNEKNRGYKCRREKVRAGKQRLGQTVKVPAPKNLFSGDIITKSLA